GGRRGGEALRRDRAALRRPRGGLHARRQAGCPPRGCGGALGGRAGRARGREDRESRPEEAAPPAHPGKGKTARRAAPPPGRGRVSGKAESWSVQAARGGSRAGLGWLRKMRFLHVIVGVCLVSATAYSR